MLGGAKFCVSTSSRMAETISICVELTSDGSLLDFLTYGDISVGFIIEMSLSGFF